MLEVTLSCHYKHPFTVNYTDLLSNACHFALALTDWCRVYRFWVLKWHHMGGVLTPEKANFFRKWSIRTSAF